MTPNLETALDLLKVKNSEIDALRAGREAESELHGLQMAAISAAALGNTLTTATDRIRRDHPYWTPAYQDVCDAVDREMAHRARAERAEADRSAYNTLVDQLNGRQGLNTP